MVYGPFPNTQFSVIWYVAPNLYHSGLRPFFVSLTLTVLSFLFPDVRLSTSPFLIFIRMTFCNNIYLRLPLSPSLYPVYGQHSVYTFTSIKFFLIYNILFIFVYKIQCTCCSNISVIYSTTSYYLSN